MSHPPSSAFLRSSMPVTDFAAPGTPGDQIPDQGMGHPLAPGVAIRRYQLGVHAICPRSRQAMHRRTGRDHRLRRQPADAGSTGGRRHPRVHLRHHRAGARQWRPALPHHADCPVLIRDHPNHTGNHHDEQAVCPALRAFALGRRAALPGRNAAGLRRHRPRLERLTRVRLLPDGRARQAPWRCTRPQPSTGAPSTFQ